MNRRSATTLTEVLVAIFVMGIGLMAILSLFPVGASQMAQALKDQRCAEAAANAGSLARLMWKQACDADITFMGPVTGTRPEFREDATQRKYPRAVQRFVMAMDDPNFNDQAGSTPNPISYPGTPVPIPPGTTGVPGGFIMSPAPGSGGVNQYTDMLPMPLTGPQANLSSYPVLVDMVGWSNLSSDPNRQLWVGHPRAGGGAPLPQAITAPGTPKTGLIPRRPLYMRDPTPGVLPTADWKRLGIDTPLVGFQRIQKQFSLVDDMSFNFDGTPDLDNDPKSTATSTPPETGTSVQRVGRYSWAYLLRRTRNKDFRTEVDVQVIVYSGRSLDVATDEVAYPAFGNWDSRFVRMQYGPSTPGNLPKPAVRRGTWVLDATMFNSAGAPDPQGRFYRVVNVDDSIANQITVELQTPLAPTGPQTTQRVFVVMNNVVEVFQIGFVSPTTPPRNILDDHEY